MSLYAFSEAFTFDGYPRKMEKEKIGAVQEKKVEQLHWEIQQWKSRLQFMDDEILFTNRLLDSYAFQPNTRNLFERLQDFKARLKSVRVNRNELKNRISKHENTLGGMLECTDSACDMGYYLKHDKIQTETDESLSDFQKLKSEIFNYAGGILKKRKP
jgi:hypothetical protein